MTLATKLARLLLVAALLVAQHSALAHGIWHVADADIAPHSSHDEGSLCDQHAALGTVLGALGNSAAAQQPAAEAACAVPAAPHASAGAALVAPSSRDPPSLP
jgi:hypothetical protein